MTLNEIYLKTGVPADYIIRTVAPPPRPPVRQALREWIHNPGKMPRDIRDAVPVSRGQALDLPSSRPRDHPLRQVRPLRGEAGSRPESP